MKLYSDKHSFPLNRVKLLASNSFRSGNSWCCTRLLQALSSTINSSHTFCGSLLLEEVSFPETNNRLTCTLGRSQSIWSLMLGMYPGDDARLSLRSGTWEQETNFRVPLLTILPVCKTHKKALKRTSGTPNSSALAVHDLRLAFEASKTKYSRASLSAYQICRSLG